MRGHRMQVYSGKSVFGGIAIGKISVYRKNEQQVKRVRTEDTKGELARYEAAKAAVVEQLQELYQKALKEVGEANAAIFEIHQMMLDDGDYNESVENIIETQKVNAEYAVAVTGDNFAQMFRAMDDDYMRERAADVKDISERVLSVLNGCRKGKVITDEPVIIVADDLAPSETVQLEKDMVLSFVTVHGSVNSHTAILARTMAIPALIGTEELPLDDTVDGKLAVVDGLNGKIYVEPDAQTLEEMKKRRQAELEKKELLQLIRKAKAKDPDAFSSLIYFYMKDLYRVAISILMNDEDAADAIQDTILGCWEKLQTLKKEKYFKTWITRVLINRCYDIRKKQQRITVLEEYEEPSAEDQYNVELKEALGQLDEKYRIVLVLYYSEGYQTGEIAEFLEIPRSTVQTRLQRGREKLEAYYR